MSRPDPPHPDQPLREFDVLRAICAPGRLHDPRIQIGPGDDLASIAMVAPGQTLPPGDRPALVGVDQLVDGIHVDLRQASLAQAGRKAVARSVSDIAAMAGRPVGTVVAALVPRSFSTRQSGELFDAMEQAATEFHAPLIGGDLSVHREEAAKLSCAVTVLAIPPAEGAVTRGGARPGDGLYVTGVLGGGWTTDHHLVFRPRLAEATMLRTILGQRLHAMIDLSDGLGRDVGHLVESRPLDVTVTDTSVPVRPGFDLAAALGDGEDYELAFAAEGDVPEQLGGCPVHRIGTFREGTGKVLLHRGETVEDLSGCGWEHGLP